MHKFTLLAATAVSAMLSIPAFAQAGANEDASAIVVTARRVEERLQDVPISITVFNQAQLDNRNITTASDLATYTPSLSSNNRFGSDKSSFTIRGFNQDGKTAPTVAVYFADVVALRANSGTGGSNGSGPGSFFDLQNVQVLKGPQGTLFGRNTTGGAILLVPQKPTEQLEGYVEGSVGNYDLKRIQAVINIPVSDTFKVRLGVDRQKREGYLRNRSGVGPEDFGDSNYLALRGSIVADLTPTLENYTIVTYSRSDTNGSMLKIAQCNRAAGLTGRPAIYAPLACQQIDRERAAGYSFYDVANSMAEASALTSQWQVINTTTWSVSDAVTVKNIASYGEFREKFIGNIGGEFWIPSSGPLAGLIVGNTTTAPAPGQYNNAQNAFTDELQIQGRAFENRLMWQAGAYLEVSKPSGTGDTTYSGTLLFCSDLYALKCITQAGISGLGSIFNKISNRNIGFYGQGTFKISDQFSVTAGARYTIDRMEGIGGRLQYVFGQPNVVTAVSCSNPRIIATQGNLSPLQCTSALLVNNSSKPTWVLDLEYKPIPDAMIYAKYSRGYRQGGVDPSVIGLESWNAEKVDTYEVGAKTTFSGAVRGYFNFAGFYNNFVDQQLALTVVGKPGTGISGARAIINAGKSRIWGVEADASVTLFDSLRFDAGYAYLNTQLQAFVTPTLPATSPYNPPAAVRTGIDLPLSPHHRVTLTVTYTLPLDESIGRISLGATYTHTGTQLASADIGPFTQLPASNLVNANVNWNGVMGTPIDLAFFVTNLTKEQYQVNVSNSFNSSGYESYIPNMPRMYGLRLKYRFGN
jgi:iron complex outermembrane receptor protein